MPSDLSKELKSRTSAISTTIIQSSVLSVHQLLNRTHVSPVIMPVATSTLTNTVEHTIGQLKLNAQAATSSAPAHLNPAVTEEPQLVDPFNYVVSNTGQSAVTRTYS